MKIKQFEDKNLAHYSYAIISNGEIALIDPARDPQPYYDFAKKHQALIKAVIETHPHADFVSSHLEIHNTTGATIYASALLDAEYEHQPFDEGNALILGSITLKPLNTPGHSPDSISIVAVNEEDIPQAVFTGDTLFVGDCGRPDLREQAGAITAKREDLARQMYFSLRNKLMHLPDETKVFPAHGAGSLCGKGFSRESSSTIGAEKKHNWSLQPMSEDAFIKELLTDQPFIPKYFPFDVMVNKKGAAPFEASISRALEHVASERKVAVDSLKAGVIIIDSRPEHDFKKSHLKGAVNLMNGAKFETWLGSIVNPNEPFYLIAENQKVLTDLIHRTAKIGYEQQLESAFVSHHGDASMQPFDSSRLEDNQEAYTIIDIRNEDEVRSQSIFGNAVHIPLHQLRERSGEIPVDKPIVVHCAGGYRSAAGSSIVQSAVGDKTQVYDLGNAVSKFINELAT